MLINDILDFSKMESSRLSMSIESAGVRDIIAEAVHNMETLAERGEQKLVTCFGSSSALVQADPSRIVQVLTNLIGNALKFSGPGTSVRISLAEEDGIVRVSVEDEGPGISQEDMPKLFQKFRQLDGSSTRRVGGTGP